MNFNDPMPYEFYSGVRNGGPDHIKAILEYAECKRDEEETARIWAEEDADAADAKMAQWEEDYRNQSADYLRPCYDDKDYR
jgi:hypothetical protein